MEQVQEKDKAMKELLNETMTRAAHELDMARMERANFRLFIATIVLIILLVGSNAGWVYYESRYTDEVTTTIDAVQETEDGGNNTVVGGDYGTTESKDNNN